MDPVENLKQQLWRAKCIRKGIETGDCDEIINDAAQLADLVIALHEWVENGGFMPTAWPEPL